MNGELVCEQERAEYVIHAKLKNNLLLSRILERHKTVNAFCKASGLSAHTVGLLVNLKNSALLKDGEWSATALKLSQVLDVDPEELFSAEQRVTKLRTNEAFVELTRQQALHMADPLAALEAKDLVAKLLAVSKCTSKEKLLLTYRYEQGQSLDEVGKIFDLTRERIRQIEHKAVRKLQEAAREEGFHEFADVWQGA